MIKELSSFHCDVLKISVDWPSQMDEPQASPFDEANLH